MQQASTNVALAEGGVSSQPLHTEFEVIQTFFQWYESQGERRAGLPVTSLESIYTDLHVFLSYARDITHKVDRFANKWRRVTSRRHDGTIRSYLQLAVKDIAIVHINLTTLFAQTIVDKDQIEAAIQMITRHESENDEALQKAKSLLPDLSQQYDKLHRQFHKLDPGSDHPIVDFRPIDKPQKHHSSTEEQLKIDQELNALIKKNESLKSVIRQRFSALRELGYCKALLVEMLDIEKDIQSYFDQSGELLEKAAKAQSCEDDALQHGCNNLGQHYQQQIGEEVEDLMKINQQLKNAIDK